MLEVSFKLNSIPQNRLIKRGLHPLIYYELILSLVDRNFQRCLELILEYNYLIFNLFLMLFLIYGIYKREYNFDIKILFKKFQMYNIKDVLKSSHIPFNF